MMQSPLAQSDRRPAPNLRSVRAAWLGVAALAAGVAILDKPQRDAARRPALAGTRVELPPRATEGTDVSH